jgi:putative ABC transport system permease protein
VLLTVLGGLLGLALSFLVIRAFNQSGILRYAQFTINLRVFAYGILIAVVFGLVSGVYPAWRMSRLNAVDALKGGVSR